LLALEHERDTMSSSLIQESEAQESQPELVTRSEAARILGVHNDTIYRWSRKGFLNPVKLPSGISRYRRAELEDIKNGRKQPAAG